MRLLFFIFLFSSLFGEFLVGVGGYDVCKKGEKYIAYDGNCKIVDNITSTIPKNVNGISIWITKGWKKEWINLKKVQEAMDKGKIPVFIYFWFGDKIIVSVIFYFLNKLPQIYTDKFIATRLMY